jgi:hypothetical protein
MSGVSNHFSLSRRIGQLSRVSTEAGTVQSGRLRIQIRRVGARIYNAGRPRPVVCTTGVPQAQRQRYAAYIYSVAPRRMPASAAPGTFRALRPGRRRGCLVMMTFTSLPSVLSDHPVRSLISYGWRWLPTWPVSRVPPATTPSPTCAASGWRCAFTTAASALSLRLRTTLSSRRARCVDGRATDTGLAGRRAHASE